MNSDILTQSPRRGLQLTQADDIEDFDDDDEDFVVSNSKPADQIDDDDDDELEKSEEYAPSLPLRTDGLGEDWILESALSLRRHIDFAFPAILYAKTGYGIVLKVRSLESGSPFRLMKIENVHSGIHHLKREKLIIDHIQSLNDPRIGVLKYTANYKIVGFQRVLDLLHNATENVTQVSLNSLFSNNGDSMFSILEVEYVTSVSLHTLFDWQHNDHPMLKLYAALCVMPTVINLILNMNSKRIYHRNLNQHNIRIAFNNNGSVKMILFDFSRTLCVSGGMRNTLPFGCSVPSEFHIHPTLRNGTKFSLENANDYALAAYDMYVVAVFLDSLLPPSILPATTEASLGTFIKRFENDVLGVNCPKNSHLQQNYRFYGGSYLRRAVTRRIDEIAPSVALKQWIQNSGTAEVWNLIGAEMTIPIQTFIE